MSISFPFRILTLAVILLCQQVNAQQKYQYTVDLTKVKDDKLTVNLLSPAIATPTVNFYLPKIVPGTYMNSNYGKYVHDLKAFDKAGNLLSVKKTGDNSWQIKNAQKLHRVSYQVEDTWDSEIDNMVYSMCGTNFEEGKNFVLNTCGIFGFFEGKRNIPFQLDFTKPANFFAATGLNAVKSTTTNERFISNNADELYDSPIMFSLPDTSTVMVGRSKVTVSVYSPKKMVTADFIAKNMQKLLFATKDYLGGKLPVDNYAFIFYFNSEQQVKGATGAWEHSYSSFYSMPELPQEKSIEEIIDIAAHEFFHIVTPLTISSKEVKEFNFNETNLSKHVWLYEGSTEYYAHHMQVWTGLRTPAQFLEAMEQKINYSRNYFNDSLSFTELSTESAGKWKDQYVNVYLKGALISACMDLYLLELSNAQYGFKDLKQDLGVKYGKDTFFLDNQLFDDIVKLSFPEISSFLQEYIEKGTPIPYAQFFGYAGVQYIPGRPIKTPSLGGIGFDANEKGSIVIDTENMNDFGKKMGYQNGDELVSLNGEAITRDNLQTIITNFTNNTKEGDKVTMVVRRKDASGNMSNITLSASAILVDKMSPHELKFDEKATPQQLKVRKAWLGPQS